MFFSSYIKLFDFRTKFIAIILFFIPFYTEVQAQEGLTDLKDNAELVFDSLIAEFQSSESDTTRINILNEISWHFAPTNLQKSLKYADSALVLSRLLKWAKGEGYALKNKGEAFRYGGEIRKALLIHETALSIFKRINQKEAIASLYGNIGVAYYMLSDFPKAFENYNHALELFRMLELDEGVLKNLSLIGVLFYTFGRYSEAMEYYERALAIAEKINSDSDIAAQITNIGLTYLQLNKNQEAIEKFKTANEIYKASNDLYNFSVTSGNLGNAYFKQNNFTLASKQFQLALNISKEIHDNYGIAHQLANLGMLNFEQYKTYSDKKLSKQALLNAEKYFLQALELFKTYHFLDEQIYYYSKLSELYKIRNDYRQAMIFKEKEGLIRDSLYSIENNKRLAELEIKQNLALKEMEIEMLSQEKDFQVVYKRVMMGIAFLLIVVASFIYYQYKNKNRQNLLLEENIEDRKKAEESLRKNEIELNRHKNNLEQLVKKRTIELEKEIQERIHTESDLLDAIERVEAANRAKTVFLENMSHELRTPLVGILGYSSLLANEVDKSELKEMAEGINRTGNRLLNTLSMILDLARVESDKFEINITEIDLNKELTEIYQNFKGAVALKNIDFRLELEETITSILSDVGMVRVVVENLVNNAIKFTKKGNITLKSYVLRENSSEFICIDVIDTGIGIKRSELNLIFKDFKQLSEGTLKDFQGTGLGLSISKKFTEYLNGELLVDSQIGVGSKFTVKLPTQSNI